MYQKLNKSSRIQASTVFLPFGNALPNSVCVHTHSVIPTTCYFISFKLLRSQTKTQTRREQAIVALIHIPINNVGGFLFPRASSALIVFLLLFLPTSPSLIPIPPPTSSPPNLQWGLLQWKCSVCPLCSLLQHKQLSFPAGLPVPPSEWALPDAPVPSHLSSGPNPRDPQPPNVIFPRFFFLAPESPTHFTHIRHTLTNHLWPQLELFPSSCGLPMM